MKWIALGVLTGWTALVALAWWLADRRIALCYRLETDCIVRATTSRDNVLLWGPAVGLALLVALALAHRQRLNRPTNPVQHPQRLR